MLGLEPIRKGLKALEILELMPPGLDEALEILEVMPPWLEALEILEVMPPGLVATGSLDPVLSTREIFEAMPPGLEMGGNLPLSTPPGLDRHLFLESEGDNRRGDCTAEESDR